MSISSVEGQMVDGHEEFEAEGAMQTMSADIDAIAAGLLGEGLNSWLPTGTPHLLLADGPGLIDIDVLNVFGRDTCFRADVMKGDFIVVEGIAQKVSDGQTHNDKTVLMEVATVVNDTHLRLKSFPGVA